VGSLKLLQDLHEENKNSQTRLRFVVCFVLFLANLSLVMHFLLMVCGIDEISGSWCSICEGLRGWRTAFEAQRGRHYKKRPALMWNTGATLRTG